MNPVVYLVFFTPFYAETRRRRFFATPSLSPCSAGAWTDCRSLACHSISAPRTPAAHWPGLADRFVRSPRLPSPGPASSSGEAPASPRAWADRVNGSLAETAQPSGVASWATWRRASNPSGRPIRDRSRSRYSGRVGSLLLHLLTDEQDAGP